MLALTLRSLERDGLITREVFPEVPPRVEYELTSLGKSLLRPMQALVDWGTTNWDSVKKAQSRFDFEIGAGADGQANVRRWPFVSFAAPQGHV